jgi:hypothetical protein
MAHLLDGGLPEERCMKLDGHDGWHKDVYGRRWRDIELLPDLLALREWKRRVADENWKPCRETRRKCKLHG